jgi:thiol-disulfide isomerase/thioredoxin
MRIFKYLLFAVLLCALFSGFSHANAAPAPSFALYNLKGQLISLRNEIKDKNVIIAFFASYCIPCKTEIPELVTIAERNQSTCKLLLVNIDKEGSSKAEEFLSGINVRNQECLLDLYQMVISKYVPETKIPAFFLVNKRGDILMKSIGGNSRDIEKLGKMVSNLK